MKKYPITFTTDYSGGNYSHANQTYIDICKKWKGKKVTIAELEGIISELGVVVFDGEEIEVYNDYRE